LRASRQQRARLPSDPNARAFVLWMALIWEELNLEKMVEVFVQAVNGLMSD